MPRLQQQDAESLAAWERDQLHSAPPGGETLLQMTQRVRAAYVAMLAAGQDKTVGLVAHGGPPNFSSASLLVYHPRPTGSLPCPCLPIGVVHLRAGGYPDSSQRYAPPVPLSQGEGESQA